MEIWKAGPNVTWWDTYHIRRPGHPILLVLEYMLTSGEPCSHQSYNENDVIAIFSYNSCSLILEVSIQIGSR